MKTALLKCERCEDLRSKNQKLKKVLIFFARLMETLLQDGLLKKRNIANAIKFADKSK